MGAGGPGCASAPGARGPAACRVMGAGWGATCGLGAGAGAGAAHTYYRNKKAFGTVCGAHAWAALKIEGRKLAKSALDSIRKAARNLHSANQARVNPRWKIQKYMPLFNGQSWRANLYVNDKHISQAG